MGNVIEYPSERPVVANLQLYTLLSFLVMLLILGSSAIGLFCTETVYPTDELRLTYLPNDIVTLLTIFPLLLVSVVLANRGSILGLLIWPGVLFSVFYNYMIYTLALPINVLFINSLLLATLSLFLMISLLSRIVTMAAAERVVKAQRGKMGAWVLIILGGLFCLRSIFLLAGLAGGEAPVSATEQALLIADVVITPVWVVGGALMLHRHPFGLVAGPGLLVQASLLMLGLLLFLILQSLLTEAEFLPGDVAAVAVMSLFLLIPTVGCLRGISHAVELSSNE